MKIHSIKYNFIMNAIMTVSAILFPLITFPYVSRVLLVEGSGRVAFATSVVTYFTMFATLGLPTYGVRACARVRDDREKLSRTVQELLIISGITTVITYIVFFASLIFIPKFAASKELLMVSGISIGLSTIGVQWFYNALEQYSYITTCAIVFKLIGLLLMFLLVKKPEDYLIYGGIYVIGSFGSYVLNFIRLRKFVTFRKSGEYHLKEHLQATVMFFLLSAAASVYLNLDVVMLGFMKNDTVVGYYNAGTKVKSVLVTCVTSLGTVLLPRLSYYIQYGNKEEFRKMVGKAFNFVSITAGAVMVYFTICARESILLLTGSERFLPAIMPMCLLMPTVLFIGLSNVTGIQVLTPLGEEKKVVISVVSGAVLDFVLNLVLIPKFGASGAAFSTLMAEILVLVIQVVCLKDMIVDMLKEVQFWKIGISLIIAAAVSGSVYLSIELPVLVTLFLEAVLFFGVYGIFLLVLREKFVVHTLNSVWEMLKKKRA